MSGTRMLPWKDDDGFWHLGRWELLLHDAGWLLARVRYPHKTAARIIAWGIALAILVWSAVRLVGALP
jgi:hypothetical protein